MLDFVNVSRHIGYPYERSRSADWSPMTTRQRWCLVQVIALLYQFSTAEIVQDIVEYTLVIFVAIQQSRIYRTVLLQYRKIQ